MWENKPFTLDLQLCSSVSMKILLLAAALLFPSVTQAHNNLFFPGDAYFSSEWRVGGFDVNKSSMSLSYKRLSNMFMLCGYAGCESLDVTNISMACRKNLETVNSLLIKKHVAAAKDGGDYVESEKSTRPHERLKSREIPYKYFDLFIYNRDYNYTTHGIGYKFNEDWGTLQTDAMKRRHAIYDGIGRVTWDFQYAKVVPGLKLQSVPKNLEAGMGVKEPLEGSASDFSFVIVVANHVESQSVAPIWGLEKEDSKKGVKLAFYVVDDRIRYFEAIERKIVEKPWK